MDDKLFKKAVGNSRELGISNFLVGVLFATKSGKDLTDGKADDNRLTRTNVAVKKGQGADRIEATPGRYGAFIRTFMPGEQRKPVISMDGLRLEDVRAAAEKINDKDFRGIIQNYQRGPS